MTTADGAAAPGVIAVLVPWGHSVEVTDGRSFDDDAALQHATADTKGILHFTRSAESFLFVAIDSAGEAYLRDDEIQRATRDGVCRIALQPWGGMKGRRMVGDLPGSGRDVVAWTNRDGPDDQDDSRLPSVNFSSTVKTDAQGYYRFDRLPPGPVYLSPKDATRWGKSIERPMEVIEVQPGGSVIRDIGGKGRPVMGSVVLPPEIRKRDDWEFWFCAAFVITNPTTSPMPSELIQKPLTKQIEWWTRFNSTSAAADRKKAKEAGYREKWAGTYPFSIEKDDTFRIDDVAAGRYEINFLVTTKKIGSASRTELAEGHATFEVPRMEGGRSDIPLRIPPISTILVSHAHAGDVAPDFTVSGFDDKPITLSSFRGRYVLLDFWATWCGPCVDEADDLKAVVDRFAGPKFVALGLSADETPDAPARFVIAHQMNWRQGYLDGFANNSKTAQDYGVDGFPSLWLIGPDGTVVGRNLRLDQLETLLAHSLAH